MPIPLHTLCMEGDGHETKEAKVLVKVMLGFPVLWLDYTGSAAGTIEFLQLLCSDLTQFIKVKSEMAVPESTLCPFGVLEERAFQTIKNASNCSPCKTSTIMTVNKRMDIMFNSVLLC